MFFEEQSRRAEAEERDGRDLRDADMEIPFDPRTQVRLGRVASSASGMN
jgi:hypothetical protein